MAAKKSNPGFDFIVEQLKKDKGVEYSEVKAAADKKGMTIHPIMYGRAKALLGLVKVAARGKGKSAQAKAAKVAKAATSGAGAAPKRGPGRPRKNAVAAGIDTSSLDGIIAAVKSSQQEKDRYRSALEKIQQVLAGVLA